MKTRLIIIFLAALLTGGAASAQQIPMYSQYYYNPFLYNPSAAGRLDVGNAFLINRQQWTGIPGAPVTRVFTIDGPIKSEKVGLGFSAYDDVTDVFERIGASLSYSYRLNFSSVSNLRLGLSVGAADNRIDLTKVTVKDPNDQVLMGQTVRTTSYSGSFGLLYTYKNLEIGAAIPQLLSSNVKYLSTNNTALYYNMSRHFVGTARYAFHFGEDKWKLEPIVFAQYVPGSPVLLDAGAVLTYRDRVWGGVMYRQSYAVTASLGVRLHERVILGYAYDATTGRLGSYSGGTHEIMVGITLGHSKKAEVDKTSERLDKIESRLDRHDKRIDSLGNDLKTNDVKTDSAHTRIKELQDEIDGMEQLLKNMKKDSVTGRNNVNEGDKYMLNNIYFSAENNDVLPSSYEQLNKLANVLASNPNMKIQVDGYADISGPAKMNQKLSRARAEAVKFYLMSQGAKADQIEAVGKGTADPRADNSTAAGRKMNRRVEITILKK